MTKKIVSLVMGLILLTQTTYAAQVASFVVQVNPSTAAINQAVDLSVQAVDSAWNVVQDYDHNIFIEVPAIKDLQDVNLPSDGIYTFSPGDQWQKVFSKWLTIKTAGAYEVQVSDIENDAIKGKATITIAWSQATTSVSKITFSSPLPSATETSSTVSVVGNAGIKNAKVDIILNGTKIKEEKANDNGDFTTYVTDLTAGEYILKAQVKDIQGAVAAESESVPFTYQPAQFGDIQAFDVLPSKTLKQWQKATFTVRLQEEATAVELQITDSAGKVQKLPLDKFKPGIFQKQMLMDVAGTFTIDASYTISDKTQDKPGLATISVIPGLGIKEVASKIDPVKTTEIQLAWKPIGEVKYVLAKYGTQKDALGTWVLLTGSEWVIAGINVSESSYYIRIFPANDLGEIIGEPSDIILVEQLQGSAPVCRIQGITVSTKKVGDQYFLTWAAADSAERYIIYRSDRPTNTIAEMQKVGETSDTKFPYPFDPKATKDAYSYYAVVAVCQDGSMLQLDGTKKVKVGPMTNILLVTLFSLMVFGIYRMRKLDEPAS